MSMSTEVLQDYTDTVVSVMQERNGVMHRQMFEMRLLFLRDLVRVFAIIAYLTTSNLAIELSK
jgi:hypothetical protein